MFGQVLFDLQRCRALAVKKSNLDGKDGIYIPLTGRFNDIMMVVGVAAMALGMLTSSELRRRILQHYYVPHKVKALSPHSSQTSLGMLLCLLHRGEVQRNMFLIYFYQ